MWVYFQAKNLSHSEGTWLCDQTFQLKIYPIQRGPGYVIVSLGMKSNPFWGDKTMWLYYPAKNLSHSEGTWLCDYVIILLAKNLSNSEETWLCYCFLRNEINTILRGPDYVIILPVKNLSHSEVTWLCDCILRNEI